MKFSNLFLKTVLYLICVVGFMACGDDPVETKPTDAIVKDVSLSRKTAYGDDWIYFSFSKGTEITVDETTHKTDMNWDIAFNRSNVRTNSGKSGDGQGGVYNAGKVEFKDVTTANTTGYIVDDTLSILKVMGEYMVSTGSQVFKDAISLQGMPPAYSLNDHIYVVKTADGKYAKIWLTSYNDDEGKSGLISFRYAYQPDGSTNLK